MTKPTPALQIVSFGYLHRPLSQKGDPLPPTADITLDLRHHFRDPHVSPTLRYMTAHDAPVREAVLNTPGIEPLIEATLAQITAYLQGPSASSVTLAVGCAGGRHRAATVAAVLHDRAARAGISSVLTHSDLAKDVVER